MNDTSPLSTLTAILRSPRRLALLAAALAVPSAIIAGQLYVGFRAEGIRFRFPAALLSQLCLWELWIFAGPIAWDLEKRWPVQAPLRGPLLRHAAAALALATAVAVVFLTLYQALVRIPGVSGLFAGLNNSLRSMALIFFVSHFHVQIVIYAGVVAAARAVRTRSLLRASEHQTLRLEAELTGAKLAALRTQLQPHFLFNTLHTIGSLVLQRQNDRAVELLAELGELLRSTLAHRDVELTPLHQEMQYLHRYLKIEEARFGDRLRVDWQIDPEALDALVPPFILQPLVENAFKHGISRRTENATLRIAAVRDGDSVRITIYNEGPPLEDSFALETSDGYGLRNVAERLRTRKPAGRVELTNADAGVRATLILPWDLQPTA